MSAEQRLLLGVFLEQVLGIGDDEGDELDAEVDDHVHDVHIQKTNKQVVQNYFLPESRKTNSSDYQDGRHVYKSKLYLQLSPPKY